MIKRDNSFQTNYAVYLIILFTALHIALIWSSRLLPFVDLPDHLATATILKYYGSPDNVFSLYYELGSLWGKPNVFHIYSCTLGIFPSVEIANKIYYSLYLLLFPLSVLLIIRHLEGNPTFALLTFLLIYNLNVVWGFAGYTLAIPVFLLIFLLILRYLDKPAGQALLLIAGGLIWLFTLHALMTVFALSVLFICAADRMRVNFRQGTALLTCALPVACIIAFWWAGRQVSDAAGPGFIAPLVDYYRSNYLSSFPGRVRLLFLDNYALYPGWPGVIAGLFFGCAIVVFPAIAFTTRKGLDIINELIAPKNRPVTLLTAWSLFCFSCLPGEIYNFQVLYLRFSSIFLIGLIILSASLFRKSSKIHLWVIIIVCLIHFGLWSAYFYDFNRANAAYNKDFFPADSKSKELGALVYDLDFRGKPVYIHMPSYYIVWTHGIGTFRIVDFVDFAPPLRRRPHGPKVPVYREWDAFGKSPMGDYEKVDYLLLRGKKEDLYEDYLNVFDQEKAAEKWFLFKKRRLDKRIE
jgi:hypothetical protein